jgi:hypothetical protein
MIRSTSLRPKRLDVVVDFSRYQRGTQVRLTNRLGSETTAEVMRFDITGADRSDDSTVPDHLGNSKALDPHQAVGPPAHSCSDKAEAACGPSTT